MLGAVLTALAIPSGAALAEPPDCPFGGEGYFVTGYSRHEFGAFTADGTPIYTPEPIAAASDNLPLGAHVWVEYLGRFRVADRGIPPAPRWLDIAVWDRATAYGLTGWYCVWVEVISNPDRLSVSAAWAP